MITKTVLLTCLLQLIVRADDQSVETCIPDFFRYVQDMNTDEISGGRIEIRRAPKGIALQISIALSIATVLPSNYVGRIELAQSKEQSVKAVQQGRPLKYNLYFPLRRPVPTLTGLWFNNQLICHGPRAIGQIVTNIVLNHTLYPPGVVPLTIEDTSTLPKVDVPTQQPVSKEPTVMVPVTTSKPKVKPKPQQPKPQQPVLTETRQPSEERNAQDCGRSNNSSRINLLIAGGMKTSVGQWPWLVAIYITKNTFELQCAGSLVTDTHVITAAHCFQLDNETLLPGVFLVSLGRYVLRDWRETGSVNREVTAYKLHPDYRVRDQESAGSADSDLAVLVLREKVEFTATIKPICLWSGSISLEAVVDRPGFVVGWGRDEWGNKYLQEPRLTKSRIVSQENCLRSNRDFVLFTSNRTFCAGSRNGSGPCNGDSGSGFVMYDTNTDRYYLRGVVSRSLLDRSTMSCDLTQYVVYVDVAQYLDWIQQQISA